MDPGWLLDSCRGKYSIILIFTQMHDGLPYHQVVSAVHRAGVRPSAIRLLPEVIRPL